MIFVGGFLGRGIALALLGDDVNQDRAGLVRLAHVAQHRQQVIEVVPVDRADIIKAQFLEQGAAGEDAAGVFLGAVQGPLDAAGKALGHLGAEFAQAEEAARGHQPRQVGAHGADRRGDRHVVVVQHHDQPRMQGAGVVHRLIGHARAHGAVADHADDVAVVVALQVARHRHAKAGGDRGGGMRRAEGVVFALGAFGEAGQAAGLAQGADAVAPSGQDLVRIGLMANVPQQPVARGVENGVDRHRQFDDAKRGAEMAAGHGHRVHGFRAQLIGELA